MPLYKIAIMLFYFELVRTTYQFDFIEFIFQSPYEK